MTPPLHALGEGVASSGSSSDLEGDGRSRNGGGGLLHSVVKRRPRRKALNIADSRGSCETLGNQLHDVNPDPGAHVDSV